MDILEMLAALAAICSVIRFAIDAVEWFKSNASKRKGR
jgi:hypothetical protein